MLQHSKLKIPGTTSFTKVREDVPGELTIKPDELNSILSRLKIHWFHLHFD